MSNLTRTLIIGATLAATCLAGMTTVAHASDEPTRQDARRPPTQGQVGEAWHQHPVTSQQKTEETAADATLGRVLAREHFSIPNQPSAQVPTPAPTRPNRQPGWLLASFGVLAATLMLAGGLAVLAARRASRRAPPPAPSLPR